MRKGEQNYTRRISIFLISFCMTLSIGHKSTLAGEQVVFYDSIKIEGTFRDGKRFNVSVSSKPYDGAKSCSGSYFIGTDGYDPSNIPKNISFAINDKTIEIPERFTCDFADVIIPGGVYLMEDGNIKLLYVRGGDGVAGYRMIFKVRNGSLISRTERSLNQFGELEDKVITIE